jgi:hypothetical protein
VSFIADAAAITSFCGFVCGIAILVSPSTVRVKSRWMAMPVGFAIFAAAGIAQILSPDPAANVANVRTAGVTSIAIWFGIFSLGRFLTRRSGAKNSTSLQPEDGGHVEKPKIGAPTIRAKVDGWFARQQANLDAKREVERKAASEHAKWIEQEAKGADGRLQEQYDALQDGKITLEEYQSEIEFELDQAKTQISSLREMRRLMDRDEYETEREKADEDLEAARWRLGWVKDQIREKGDRPEWMEKSGKWARFEFADRDGLVTRQEISMWKAYPNEVRGWDRKLKREVGFRFGGISAWVAG